MPQLYVYAAAVVLLCALAAVAWRLRSALRETARRLDEAERWISGVRLANEAAAVAVWEWDLDHDRMRGDEQLAHLFGVPAGYAPASLAELLADVHPADAEALCAHMNAARETNDRVDAEFRVRGEEQSTRYLHLRGACIADSRSRRRLMVGAIWDVSDERAHQLELERYAGHLAAAYATSPVAIFVTTLDGRIVEVNDTAVAMTGYSRQTLSALNVAELGFWRGQPESFEAFSSRLQKGRVLHRIARFLRQDGMPRDAEISATLIDRINQPHVLYMIEDVTEQRRQSTALRESEERFARIFEISPDPIALVSEDGRIVEANPAFLRFSQYDIDELRGNTTEALGLWAATACAERFKSYLATHRDAENIESMLRRKNGELAHCQVSWSGFDLAGERYVLLIAHDITELKQRSAEVDRLNASLEKMVQARTAQLVSANRELESFSYSVSHDLRAPLRHISGFASLLGERPSVQSDAEARRLIGVVIRAAGRMGALIDDLLAFSRVSRQQMSLQEVPLDELVRDVVQEFSAAEEGREVQWRIGALPTVRGDRQLLRSVMMNLLDNALKYTRPRPVAVIEIGARERDGMAEIYVRDNGVGFDMQYAKQLFDVFQRLHRQEDFEGTGVGLANVQRIVERHGGRVWAEGEAEQGATFWISLPVSHDKPPVWQPPPTAPERSAKQASSKRYARTGSR
ncbi:MAG TPA: PAS domain S-box protein [Burkholderiales bacterium]|nr:PAS domain S-box protein [Burkholderiales bacterium]